MSSTIYLLRYNNYYNRLVKKETNLSNYLKTEYYLSSKDGINFFPNDGVNTKLEINYNGEEPDYVIVAEGNEIKSRWFVIECQNVRGQQFTLTLHRDLLVDEYDNYINAPCFIEKATLSKNDPMIFNKEDMTFNQIKTSETPLKDETGCAWVVGYIPKDAFNGDEASRTVQGDIILDTNADITVDNLNNWTYYDYINGTYYGPMYEDPIFIGQALINISNINYWARFMVQGTDYSYRTPISNKYSPPEQYSSALTVNNLNGSSHLSLSYVQKNASRNWANQSAVMKIMLKTVLNLNDSANAIKRLNSKVIYESSSKRYFRIRIVENAVENTGFVTTSMPDLFDQLKSYMVRQVGTDTNITGNPDNRSFQYVARYNTYNIYLDQIYTSAKVVLNQPADRYHLEDQPYDMFCMPYSDDFQIYKNGVELVKANKSIAVNMATQIGAATGSGNIYDIQLLPYCPVRYCIAEDNTFDIGNNKVDYIKDVAGNTIGVLLWATSSAFTIDILHNIDVSDPKESNQLDLYRLTSPNFNGQFEFSPAMNGGVDSFNVDCNYKPYNPYIHINPNFKNLYGQDFNDARGLICGGDFSLPQLSNAWANYQLNNKNYQNIFDREIQNMEVQNKYTNIQNDISAVVGTIQGGIMGAMVGNTPGGRVGGAIAGTLASAAGGVADAYINRKLQAEALDYKRDMYTYQLGNIQALPTSLTKTSAFTYNNKIFPILEYYTCTDQEKQAFRNKLKYNGMSVGRIGTINEFIGNDYQYIKGRLIRVENISNDFNYVSNLSDEIFKGAFFK